MERFDFNFANLSEEQAREAILSTENLDFGRVYNFGLFCKEGFKALTLTMSKDGAPSWESIEMIGDLVLAGITTYCEDGEIEYRTEILTREEFNAFKAAADANPRYEDDGHFNGYVEYEDLLANW